MEAVMKEFSVHCWRLECTLSVSTTIEKKERPRPSTLPDNPGDSWFWAVSSGFQIRVWYLLDNRRSLPFLVWYYYTKKGAPNGGFLAALQLFYLFGHPRGTWVFSKLQGLQYYFSENFRCNLTFYETGRIFVIPLSITFKNPKILGFFFYKKFYKPVSKIQRIKLQKILGNLLEKLRKLHMNGMFI